MTEIGLTPIVGSMWAVAGIAAALAVLAWRQDQRRGQVWFVLLMVAVAGWVAAYALSLGADSPIATRRWHLVGQVVFTAVPVLWLGFTLAYADRPRLLRTVVPVAALLPLSVAVGALVAPGLTWRGTTVVDGPGYSTAVTSFSPTGVLVVALAFSFVAAGFVVLLRRWRSTGSFYRRQVGLVLLGAVFPPLAVVARIGGSVPFPGLDPTPYAFVANAACLFVAFFRYDLLDLSPVAREALFDRLGDPVIVADDAGRIVDWNEAAASAFDVVMGADLATAVPRLSGAVDGTQVTADGRVFEVQQSSISQSRSEGVLYHLSDVTEYNDRVTTLEALSRAAKDVVAADSHSALGQRGVDAARDVLGYEYATLYLLDDGLLVPAAATDPVRDLYDPIPTFPVGEGLMGEAYARGEPLAVDDVRESDALRDTDTGIHGAVVVPVGSRGVLAVGHDSPDGPSADSDVVGYAEVLAATLDAAYARLEREADLERQNRRLDDFASVLSHDLRNPLAVAQGHLELLEDTLPEAEVSADESGQPAVSRSFDAIENSLDRIDSLVDSLLALTRDETAERFPVSVETVAREAWSTTRADGPTLRVETELVVEADRSRLRQLFENLFRNAIEHGDATTLEVGAVDAGGFYVADDGRGVPDAVRDSLFERGVSDGGGTGLGLAVVKSIVDAHGWTVELDDAAGDAEAAENGESTGTRFVVTTDPT